MISLYDIITPGGLDTIGSWRCLANQKNALDSFQRSDMFPGGTCARRTPDDMTVEMGPAVGSGSSVSAKVGAPIPNLPPAGLPIGAVPAPFKVGPDTFQNIVYNETERQSAKVRQAKWMKELKGVDISA